MIASIRDEQKDHNQRIQVLKGDERIGGPIHVIRVTIFWVIHAESQERFHIFRFNNSILIVGTIFNAVLVHCAPCD